MVYPEKQYAWDVGLAERAAPPAVFPDPDCEVATMKLEYMWVDISNLEFGQMHESLRNLSAEGWEVDGVVDDHKSTPPGGGGSAPVSLRLKRMSKY